MSNLLAYWIASAALGTGYAIRLAITRMWGS